MLPKTCSSTECNALSKVRGMCQSHYNKAHHRGEFPKQVRDAEARFWVKVDKSGDCWNWTASMNNKGYGQFRLEGRSQQAHRCAFIFANGGIPEGLMIDHICHNRRCVNPAHLRAVTNKQNEENRAGANASSSTGVRGVGWHKAARKWSASVTSEGKFHHAGLFLTKHEAEAAVIAKRIELFTHNDLDRIPA